MSEPLRSSSGSSDSDVLISDALHHSVLSSHGAQPLKYSLNADEETGGRVFGTPLLSDAAGERDGFDAIDPDKSTGGLTLRDRLESQEVQDLIVGSSLRSSTINLINTIVGGGVVALPLVSKLVGVGLGPLLIVLVGFLSERTAFFLLWSADKTGSNSYTKIGENLFGWWGAKVVDLTILLQNLGLCTSYVSLLGDFIPSILHAWAHWPLGEFDRKVIEIAIVAVVLFIPLTSLSRLEFLKFTGTLSLLLAIFFIGTITVLSVITLNDPSDNVAYMQFPESRQITWFIAEAEPLVSFLKAIPIAFLAFVCHFNVPLIYRELRRQKLLDRDSKYKRKRLNRNKMMVVIRVALTVCSLLYVLQAVFGFLLFRQCTVSDIFKNFIGNKFPIIPFLEVAYSFVVIFCFPIIGIGLRRSVHTLFFGESTPEKRWSNVVEAIIVVAVSVALGLFVPNVGIAFGLSGSLTSVNVMYVYPSLFYITIRLRSKKYGNKFHFVMAWTTLLIGAFVCIGSTAGTLYGLTHPEPMPATCPVKP